MAKSKTNPKVTVGSRKVKKKVKNCWTKEDLSKCVDELQSTPGASICGFTKKYSVSAKIRIFVKETWKDVCFSRESEKNLAHCLGIFLFHFLLLYNGYEKKIYLF